MLRSIKQSNGERGSSTVEFAIAGVLFFTAIFAVLELGRLLWTVNALADVTRRGARHAVLRVQTPTDTANIDKAKLYAVYGDDAANPATAKPLVDGLTTADVIVTANPDSSVNSCASPCYGTNIGSVTASISTNYKFTYILPLLGGVIDLPACSTTLPSESAGQVPGAIGGPAPTPTPVPTPSATPT
ncbi:MAG: pilus assembly protein, partial [Pyrinomonadaceae bacterium]|nr:pilus assembly protein [Pyrinomonadaceae bacterium]